MKKIKCLRSGHTLVEMTVVVTILSVVMSLVARAQKPFSEMVMELQDRSTTSSELSMAVDYLAMDLGAAESVEGIKSSELEIQREKFFKSKKSKQNTIHYWLEDGNLIREDKKTKEKFVVATGLTGLEIQRKKGEVRIVLADGIAEDDQHSVTLVWRKK